MTDGLEAGFSEVADTIFAADLLAPDLCRDILAEFPDALPWETAKIAVSQTKEGGETEIVGIVNTDRRNARRLRFADLDLGGKPITQACLRAVQEAVSGFATAEFGMDFGRCGDAEIVRYATGGEFKPHTDTHKDNAHRAFTVILYLNDDFEGGETAFPDLGYMCRPRAGRVIFFLSTQLHASMPITSGGKSIIVFWVSFPGVLH